MKQIRTHFPRPAGRTRHLGSTFLLVSTLLVGAMFAVPAAADANTGPADAATACLLYTSDAADE